MIERLERHWDFVRDLAVQHPWQVLGLVVFTFGLSFIVAGAEVKRRRV